MASKSIAARLTGGGACLALFGCLAAAPATLSLQEAAARRASDFSPAHIGEAVTVHGQLAGKCIRFPQYAQLAIQDEHYGLVLEGPSTLFEGLKAGDRLEASGRIGVRAGLPILEAGNVKLVGRGAAPAPQRLAPDALQTFRYLGRLVVTEGRVIEVGETSAGGYLLIGEPKNSYKIFVPSSSVHEGSGFAGFAAGDRVRATGIASQYCPFPPYNRWFQLTAAHYSDVVRLEKGPIIGPAILAVILSVLAIVGVVLWMRETRLRTQRQMFHDTYALGEEILSASSASEILKKLATLLPKIFRASQVRLYVHSRGTRTLDEVQLTPEGSPVSIPLEAPAKGLQSGCAACFQNRTLLFVPDTARSPFAVSPRKDGVLPKAFLFVPMFAQGEVVGVLEVDQDDRTRVFGPDEQALAQHLANQVGLAIQLLDRRSVREQLFRTEKLAAVGRLISGVVNELQAPLAAITKMLESVVDGGAVNAAEFRPALSETRKASQIVSRLVSFAGMEHGETMRLELHRLLRNLIEFRERECKARGIRVKDLLMDRPLHVLGSPGQLEQVFLNLMVHAEQAAEQASDKIIVWRSSVLAKRVLVELSYKCGADEAGDPFDVDKNAGALGLDVCRSIITGHGGEIRWGRAQALDCHFEIELPWAPAERQAAPRHAAGRDQSLQRTALLMEPDESVQRRLVVLLSARGYRVVPVHNSDVALDLIHRVRFDIALCSVHLPGLNWVELSERIQPAVNAFILISDGYDADLAASFEEEGRFVLPQPVDQAVLDRILDTLEQPADPRVEVRS